jgi:hypothetical protein
MIKVAGVRGTEGPDPVISVWALRWAAAHKALAASKRMAIKRGIDRNLCSM